MGGQNRGVERNLSSAVGKIANRQGGIISRQQVLQTGMSPDAVRSKVKYGKLHAIHRGVYTVDSGPLTRQAQLWAALLAAGRGAVLSHETAAELLGLLDEPSPAIHVTIPRRRTVYPISRVVVHRSDRPRDVVFPLGKLPVTGPDETVLDVIEAMTDLETVRGWVLAAFAKRQVSDFTIRQAIAKRRRLRWRADLETLVTEAAKGVPS